MACVNLKRSRTLVFVSETFYSSPILIELHVTNSKDVPHSGAIKVGQQPLVGVRVERHGVFDALHQIFKFRADKRVTSVSRINVQPGSCFLSNGTLKT